MQCPACRTVLGRDDPCCPACGQVLEGRAIVFELVLSDGRRVAVTEPVTLGRATDNAVQLTDPSVSRHHVRVVPGADGARVEDAGSSYGTLVDGDRVVEPVPVRDGSEIRLGNVTIQVQRRRREDEASLTQTVGTPTSGDGPRLRPGVALKRLEAAEGTQRYVLRDEQDSVFLRLGDAHGELVAQLDGRTPMAELLARAQRLQGDPGPGRLAVLLAELGDRGLLVDAQAKQVAAPRRLARLVRPRQVVTTRAGGLFRAVYGAGGHILFTPVAAGGLAVVAAAGLVAFAASVAAGDRVPFVVGGSFGVGVVAFALGRALVVALHELSHGLAVTAMGRRVPRAGLKLILLFPYAFVDTSEAWLEPRSRRMAIAGAGPASDLVVGGLLSLLVVVTSHRTADAAFQLAIGAYLGALSNLNPFMDRDGAQLLADHLRQPGLRRRSRAYVIARLAGRTPPPGDNRTLLLTGIAGLVWSILAVGLVVLFSLRYVAALKRVASPTAVWIVLVAVWLAVAAPVAYSIFAPLAERRAHAEPADGRA